MTLKSFIDSRTGWHRVFDHPIPKHTNNLLYTFGGMLIVLFIMQGATGVLLQQYYHSHPYAPGA
ncbi:MAG TPA: hypothetical protein VFI73_08735 [Candidatus Nitrosopolaris sp.]|nr:hypothetical protein [Candidatus Nitrosopolaris sp.]